MAHIVVLMGSPRHGNTEILAQAFCGGIDKEKHTVDVISMTNTRVNGCTGCNACRLDAAHRCVQNDGMDALYARLAKADIIAAATPIYFYGVSSQLKALIDRLHNPIRNTFRVKKLVFLGVCADSGKEIDVYRPVLAMYHAILAYFHLENGGELTVYNVEAKGAIAGNEALGRAAAPGASL